MTVKELIERLEQFDYEDEVFYAGEAYSCGYSDDITDVDKINSKRCKGVLIQ